ncbi:MULTISPECIES: hypothetical protein [Agrobacterium]|jgi:hypothetical protein|uniref:hypothetical protein n=1 Tax=Agrobacterium TaxID=357 RepID=UPI000371FBA6|nr:MULTISPECIES: hypothetical protein [Agrobacterium]SNB74873.1 hypothetical protein SAMN05661103_3929 [Agrobacterium sp. 719_389]
MIIEFDPRQMNAMLHDDDDFTNYFTREVIPKHLPSFADMAGSPQATEMTRWGRRYAEHFGFSDPIYQIHFVVLMWRIGPDFFLFEPYKSILADQSQTEEQRIERCNLEPTMSQEGNAIARSDNAFWFPQYMKNNILGVPYDDIEEEFERERAAKARDVQ